MFRLPAKEAGVRLIVRLPCDGVMDAAFSGMQHRV